MREGRIEKDKGMIAVGCEAEEKYRKIDRYSYELGVMDCFCEMTASGLKGLAMSHPCPDRKEWESFRPAVQKLCQKYEISFYPEEDPLITDLFPARMNQGTCHYLFYRDKAVLQEYLAIKAERKKAIEEHCYVDPKRYELAWRLGKLLSYPDEGIRRYIRRTREEEGL